MPLGVIRRGGGVKSSKFYTFPAKMIEKIYIFGVKCPKDFFADEGDKKFLGGFSKNC